MGIYSIILVWKDFEPGLIGSFVVLLALICISAMASGSETSLFSLSPADIKTIRGRQSRSDKAVLKLLSMEDYMLATILIVNNLVNICIVILSSSIINRLVEIPSPAWAFAIKTIIVTFILLLFGEIMPKVFAQQYPLKFAGMVAVPLLYAKSFFKPVSWILVRMGGRIGRRAARNRKNISMGELSDALEMTHDQSTEEKKMLEGIVEFVNTQVEEIMRPRLDITAINIEKGFDEVRRTITESGFSRIPVYRDSIDSIEGVLYVKDMLRYIGEGDSFVWQKHLREAYYIPEHKKINDLLEEFQSNKVHLAIVVDEYGSTQGLVSLEDILEEIVGDITDESDREEDFYRKVDDRTYIFEGKTHICDMAEVLGMEGGTFDDVEGDAETLAGMMLELRRDLLSVGDSVTVHGVKFTVLSMEGRRIEKIRAEILS